LREDGIAYSVQGLGFELDDRVSIPHQVKDSVTCCMALQ